jgi:hypothetical protein
LLAICPVHGPVDSPLIGGSGKVKIINVAVSCPVCGLPSRVPDGVHDLVTGFVQTLHSAGATRQQVSRFRDIAQAVQSGDTTAEQAEEQIAELGNAFMTAWAWLNANGTAIQTIVAIIALFLMIYFQKSSDADAKKLQAATGKQIAVEQKIVSELRRQNLPVPTPQTSLQPMPQSPTIAPPRTQVRATHPNRRERRAAGARARRKPKR